MASKIANFVKGLPPEDGRPVSMPTAQELATAFAESMPGTSASDPTAGTLKPVFGRRGENESNRAIIVCNDYLRMGSGRSIQTLLDTYAANNDPLNTRTIYNWSHLYNWAERAEEYDAAIDSKKSVFAKAVLSTGLAQAHNRVDSLKKLAETLEKEILVDKHLWSPTVTGLRFNSSLVEQYRGTLDDLAKETGGRRLDDLEGLLETSKFALPADAISPSFYDAYRAIRNHDKVEYVFKGGRGSTKSSFVSEVIIELLMNNPSWHCLVTRTVGNTMRDSVYSQIVWAIGYLNLTDKFKTITSPMEITYIPTGQKIYFRGGDDPIKIKSIKPKFGYINILWFEELDQFGGPEMVRSIVQSAIRGGDDAYIFKTFNPPRSKNSWVNKDLELPKENRFVHSSDYLSVPKEWLGKTFIEEAEFLKEVNPDAYAHEYLGDPNVVGGLVFNNLLFRAIPDDEIAEFDRIYHGVDWGYFPDPAHYVKCHYDAARLTLYIYGEVRMSRASNREFYDALVAYGLTKEDIIIADSAEPKSIADFRDYGAACRKAEKGPESVKYSIKWLQSLRAIVIDNVRAPAAADEFLHYEHEVDAEGNYYSEYPDVNNHSIDATRYATNLIWKRRGE